MSYLADCEKEKEGAATLARVFYPLVFNQYEPWNVTNKTIQNICDKVLVPREKGELLFIEEKHDDYARENIVIEMYVRTRKGCFFSDYQIFIYHLKKLRTVYLIPNFMDFRNRFLERCRWNNKEKQYYKYIGLDDRDYFLDQRGGRTSSIFVIPISEVKAIYPDVIEYVYSY